MTRACCPRRAGPMLRLVVWCLVIVLLPAPGVPLIAASRQNLAQGGASAAQTAYDTASQVFGSSAQGWTAMKSPDGSVVIGAPDGLGVVRVKPPANADGTTSPSIEVWERKYGGGWEHSYLVRGTLLAFNDSAHPEDATPPKIDPRATPVPPEPAPEPLAPGAMALTGAASVQSASSITISDGKMQVQLDPDSGFYGWVRPDGTPVMTGTGKVERSADGSTITVTDSATGFKATVNVAAKSGSASADADAPAKAAVKALRDRIDAQSKAAYMNLLGKAKQVTGPHIILDASFSDYTVGSLLLVRDVYVQQLKFFSSKLGALNGLNRTDKVSLLQDILPGVKKAKLWKYLWDEFRAGRNLGWITEFQTAAAAARAQGDGQTADAIDSILGNSRNGRDQQEAMIKAQFFGAMNANPLIGMMVNAIKGDVTGDAASYVDTFDTARADSIANVGKEITRFTNMNDVNSLSELLSPQYSQVWKAASAVYGPYSRQMMDNLQGFASSFQELKGLDKETTDLYLAGIVGTLIIVSIFIPPLAGVMLGKAFVPAAGMVAAGVGFGAGTAQLTYDGANYWAASTEAQNAQTGGAVLGQEAVQLTQDKATEAAKKTALDVPFLVMDGAAFAVAAREAKLAREAVAARSASSAIAAGTGAAETGTAVRTGMSISEHIETGFATARKLGVSEEEIARVRQAIATFPTGGRALVQKAVLEFDEIGRFAKELNMSDEQLVALARARGVNSIEALVGNGKNATATAVTKDLFASVLNKRGIVIGVDTGSVARFNKFFEGASVRPQFVVTDMVNLETVNTNLGFMLAGKPVKWTEQQLTTLRNLLGGKAGDPTKFFRFDASENVFSRMFSSEDLAYGRSFLDAPNFASAVNGLTLPQLPLLTPTVLVDAATGGLITPARASQLTAGEIKQIPTAFFSAMDQNSPMFQALAQRVQSLAGAQPGVLAPAITQWAQTAVAAAGAGNALNSALQIQNQDFLNQLGSAIASDGVASHNAAAKDPDVPTNVEQPKLPAAEVFTPGPKPSPSPAPEGANKSVGMNTGSGAPGFPIGSSNWLKLNEGQQIASIFQNIGNQHTGTAVLNSIGSPLAYNTNPHNASGGLGACASCHWPDSSTTWSLRQEPTFWSNLPSGLYLGQNMGGAGFNYNLLNQLPGLPGGLKLLPGPQNETVEGGTFEIPAMTIGPGPAPDAGPLVPPQMIAAALNGVRELVGRWFRMPVLYAAASPSVSFVSTGSSTGDAFRMRVTNPTSSPLTVTIPDGLVLEPVSAAAVPSTGAKEFPVPGYCVDYAKAPPPVAGQYRIADQAAQNKFKPARFILRAARDMAGANGFHPDSNPLAYAQSIRQYALWAKQENWDLKAFGEHFVEKTKQNVLAMKQNWTKEAEAVARQAVPNRWQDISQLLSKADGLAARSR